MFISNVVDAILVRIVIVRNSEWLLHLRVLSCEDDALLVSSVAVDVLRS